MHLYTNTTYALSECHGHNNNCQFIFLSHLASNSILSPFNLSFKALTLARFFQPISLFLAHDDDDDAQKATANYVFLWIFFRDCYYILIYFFELFTSPSHSSPQFFCCVACNHHQHHNFSFMWKKVRLSLSHAVLMLQ